MVIGIGGEGSGLAIGMGAEGSGSGGSRSRSIGSKLTRAQPDNLCQTLVTSCWNVKINDYFLGYLTYFGQVQTFLTTVLALANSGMWLLAKMHNSAVKLRHAKSYQQMVLKILA